MYANGYDRWADWATTPKTWLIVNDSWTFDPADDTISDVAAAEISVAGYGRQPLDGPALIDYPDPQARLYGVLPPAWTGLAAGEAMRALVLALDGGTDATSGLIAWWAVNLATDLGDFTLSFGSWYWYAVLPGAPGTRLMHVHEVSA